MKLDILAFGAHPDDVELGCGGTLIKHIEQNLKVGIIDFTKGDLGCLLYTSPSPRDRTRSRMPSSA